jgi:hypothetical protein
MCLFPIQAAIFSLSRTTLLLVKSIEILICTDYIHPGICCGSSRYFGWVYFLCSYIEQRERETDREERERERKGKGEGHGEMVYAYIICMH